MSAYRSAILGLGLAVVAVGSIRAGAGQTQAPPPPPSPPRLQMAPIGSKGQNVTPAFEGWFRNTDGSSTLVVGYYNRNMAPDAFIDVPIGPNNKIEPGGPDQGQPTHFLLRRQYGMFSVTVPKDFVNKKLTWTIVSNGQPAAITLWPNPPYNVSPFISEFNGNTPPVVKFDPAGPELTGPPRGIAKIYAATVGEPLTLTVWVKDAPATILSGRAGGGGGAAAGTTAPVTPAPTTAGVAPAAAGGPGGGGRGGGSAVRMNWAVYRSPAVVPVPEATFANRTPAVNTAGDGKAETTVTFSQPGEYWLRAQFNDSSGEGGGGDQCCWSSTLVRVNVKPKS